MNFRNFCKATQAIVVSRLRVVRMQHAGLSVNTNVAVNCNINRSNRNQWGKQQQQQRLLSVCPTQHQQRQHEKSVPGTGLVFTTAFMFNLFGRSDEEEEETPEQKLLLTIKRSILCIQREQYDKAEQMLHLSLRMAQDMQSKDGITYVYDLMANLAMEREQFKKAEKIFADVMKRLFADGHTEESPKVRTVTNETGTVHRGKESFQGGLRMSNRSLRRSQRCLCHNIKQHKCRIC
ncbi:tetratricopeptide repeat protein 19 homolog, mitochondrial isoform X2 [Scaptodrosophila lebanonensis]|uniref:Tetratricopeptide repeat protein 19 homolog, mitochondrial isoform X2 n=1 Tax=Drosophila lebanonensis TaxID=7225 RepID=A0A6J2TPN6_DROLE|nr:tetratricopeptide repeat protein 19 homolog, mitochondrial isoform X2 [Scaptodrosophila lebanonensis]